MRDNNEIDRQEIALFTSYLETMEMNKLKEETDPIEQFKFKSIIVI